MFVLTMNRTGLRRLGVAALCGVVLTGTVMAVNRRLEKADVYKRQIPRWCAAA